MPSCVWSSSNLFLPFLETYSTGVHAWIPGVHLCVHTWTTFLVSHSVATQQRHSDFTLWHHCDMYVISYRWESHCDCHVSLTVWLSQCEFDNGSQLIWHEYSLLYHTRLTLWESHCEHHMTVMWCSQCDSQCESGGDITVNMAWCHVLTGLFSLSHYVFILCLRSFFSKI